MTQRALPPPDEVPVLQVTPCQELHTEDVLLQLSLAACPTAAAKSTRAFRSDSRSAVTADAIADRRNKNEKE